ncbi:MULTISPECIES: hypothetical protein [unclassified Methylibium]|uniref:hypothetical protein n=1 Tax=unclassified Methylibium TaxID=2633235 RepID=UPI0003F44663|nr:MULTISPECIES: hypothetical protein [unclassified Methylibium]EWS53021.1 hypothetical protein X551_04187 [Methylibium sp. T29]EWS58510.1 hypothetical protein Y694_03606 [Methylibium sp. T29-B]
MPYTYREIADGALRCNTCLEYKPCDSFYKDSKAKGGLGYRCKVCVNARAKRWSEENRELRRSVAKQFHLRNPEKAAAYSSSHWRRNKDNPEFRLKAWMRTVLRRCIVRKDDARTNEVFGYSVHDLISHIERQFLPGMSWRNFGEWHIDHIVPLSAFQIEGEHDPKLKTAWGLPNLRPLWAADNLRKNAKRIYLI